MPKFSMFDQDYAKNKKQIDKDARLMTQLEFMAKYHIGTTRYKVYFRWKSEAIKIRTSKRMDEMTEDLRESIKNRMEYERKKNYDDRAWYYKDLEEIATKNNVPMSVVRKAAEDHTISELKTAVFIDGIAHCSYQIQMRKPESIMESIC